MARESLTWQEIDTDSLPPKIAKMQEEARAAAKKADEELARIIAKKLDGEFDPDTQEIKIGHGFGKLSFAIATKRTAANKFSF